MKSRQVCSDVARLIILHRVKASSSLLECIKALKGLREVNSTFKTAFDEGQYGIRLLFHLVVRLQRFDLNRIERLENMKHKWKDVSCIKAISALTQDVANRKKLSAALAFALHGEVNSVDICHRVCLPQNHREHLKSGLPWIPSGTFVVSPSGMCGEKGGLDVWVRKMMKISSHTDA